MRGFASFFFDSRNIRNSLGTIAKRWLFFATGLYLIFAVSPAFAAACTDADLASSNFDRLTQGQTLSQVTALLVCDSTRLADEIQSLGVTVQKYQWSSPNRTIALSFRLGTLFTKSRGGLTTDVATFSSQDNILSLPKVTVNGSLYTNARVYLPSGGLWTLLGMSNGVAAPTDSSTSTFDATASTLLIPAITADGSPFSNVWLRLAPAQPWSVLGVGMLTAPQVPSSGTGTPSIGLVLLDPTTGQTRNTITSSAPAQLVATVRDANGATIPNVVVSFSSDNTYGTFTPATGTALSDTNGVATITLNAKGNISGASTVTANATISGTLVSGTLNYGVGLVNTTLGALTFGSSQLSAYGTTSVSVTVLSNGAPTTAQVPVTFTSACASSGKAFLTASVTTINGVATASYRDNGCRGTDTVTATVASGASANGKLAVSEPKAGSIQFVSVSPSSIGLRGTGGTGRQETATATFRVVDSNNNPIGGKLVTFSLSTTLGGLTLSSYSAVSDPITGDVVTNVIAGNMSTVVRVSATTDNISTQSDQLTVSTGLPSQDSFSLSASIHNIEGWDYDGVKTTLTARLADHFHNPVPDGTAVYFTSEGGSIAPSCTTIGGVCSVDFSSQALRPTNGRITVLARAIGEEAFTDLNSNGVVDNATEMIDANGASTDIGEAFVDYNENSVRDANEPYFDFDGNGAYSGPDGKFNGLLCASGAAICSTQRSMDVRASQVIVLSASHANITINGGNAITFSACRMSTGEPVGGTAQVVVTIVDPKGNAMPKDSAVSFTVTNGTILSGANQTVQDSTGCRIGFSGCPAGVATSNFGYFVVSVQSDGMDNGNGTCSNLMGNGDFQVKVTTPKGAESYASN